MLKWFNRNSIVLKLLQTENTNEHDEKKNIYIYNASIIILITIYV